LCLSVIVSAFDVEKTFFMMFNKYGTIALEKKIDVYVRYVLSNKIKE